ncbi:Uncharacterized protein TCM_018115 [Theobroma cacao]|uniref:Uncharacterized protein n=1 Tax=Theobroma cacao TaxID=3641 RepID=A0A061EE71_THECC|nr:Uncharacterized protein TCM_018115 [Theobroma cacao]
MPQLRREGLRETFQALGALRKLFLRHMKRFFTYNQPTFKYLLDQKTMILHPRFKGVASLCFSDDAWDQRHRHRIFPLHPFLYPLLYKYIAHTWFLFIHFSLNHLLEFNLI